MRLRALGLCVALICVALPAAALEATPVIEPGREVEVLQLFAPHTLETELAGGFRLENVSIRPTEIVVELRRTDGATASVRLQRRGTPGTREESRSFALARDASATAGAAKPAADLLVAAVKRNDRGSFWRAEARTGPVHGSAPPEVLRVPLSLALGVPAGIFALTALAMLFSSRRPAKRA